MAALSLGTLALLALIAGEIGIGWGLEKFKFGPQKAEEEMKWKSEAQRRELAAHKGAKAEEKKTALEARRQELENVSLGRASDLDKMALLQFMELEKGQRSQKQLETVLKAQKGSEQFKNWLALMSMGMPYLGGTLTGGGPGGGAGGGPVGGPAGAGDELAGLMAMLGGGAGGAGEAGGGLGAPGAGEPSELSALLESLFSESPDTSLAMIGLDQSSPFRGPAGGPTA